MDVSSPGWSPPPALLTSSPGWTPRRDLAPLRVRLGDLELHTVGQRKPGHGSWDMGIEDWSGWEESAPDDSSTTPHRSGDGQVSGVPRLSPRPITLRGHIEASESWGGGSLTEAINTLARIRWGTLRVDERGGLSREADVRVTMLQTTRDGLDRAMYTLTLVADDPLRHGSDSMWVKPGAQTIPNRGTVQAWPRIFLKTTAPAGITKLTIGGPWGQWRVDAPDGDYLVDTRNSEIWDQIGQRVSGVSSGPWPYVLPGGTSWTVLSMVGMVQVRIDRFEAWS